MHINPEKRSQFEKFLRSYIGVGSKRMSRHWGGGSRKIPKATYLINL